MNLSRIKELFTSKKNSSDADEIARRSAPLDPDGTPLPSTESQGTLVLYKVEEPTAAVIMAIVSNESGIPLNRLSFKSIKLLED
jgi:hypothetical protein